VFEVEPVGCEVQNEINTDGTENDYGNKVHWHDLNYLTQFQIVVNLRL
jgi:hypothetical protein